LGVSLLNTIKELKMTKRAPNGYRIFQWADGMYHVYEWSSAGVGHCIAETATRLKAIEAARKDKQRPTQLAPDAGDSAASSGIVNASAESTSQTKSTPAQRR
jgi:hypothetical protein